MWSARAFLLRLGTSGSNLEPSWSSFWLLTIKKLFPRERQMYEQVRFLNKFYVQIALMINESLKTSPPTSHDFVSKRLTLFGVSTRVWVKFKCLNDERFSNAFILSAEFNLHLNCEEISKNALVSRAFSSKSLIMKKALIYNSLLCNVIYLSLLHHRLVVFRCEGKFLLSFYIPLIEIKRDFLVFSFAHFISDYENFKAR